MDATNKRLALLIDVMWLRATLYFTNSAGLQLPNPVDPLH